MDWRRPTTMKRMSLMVMVSPSMGWPKESNVADFDPRITTDRKSTRLNSSHLPSPTLFRSGLEASYNDEADVVDGDGLAQHGVAQREQCGGLRPENHHRSEEHTSELQSLTLPDALPIWTGGVLQR